jgi:hypothetical protein
MTKERSLKRYAMKFGVPIFTATALALATGCSSTSQEMEEYVAVELDGASLELPKEIAADALESKIRLIIKYYYGSGRINYQTICEISGIQRDFGSEADRLRVWIDVNENYTEIEQKPYLLKITPNGHIIMGLPIDVAQGVYDSLREYERETSY